jgi:hypothetical protein
MGLAVEADTSNKTDTITPIERIRFFIGFALLLRNLSFLRQFVFREKRKDLVLVLKATVAFLSFLPLLLFCGLSKMQDREGAEIVGAVIDVIDRACSSKKCQGNAFSVRLLVV